MGRTGRSSSVVTFIDGIFLSAAVVVAMGCLAGRAVSDTDLADWPEPDREFRGVWVATVANIDWPSEPGLSVVEQQAELIALFDRAEALHFNAIILQVRPAADALYASDLEPWSEYLTGAMGRAPDPFYDPLAFAVEEAHTRGLELHAWFNPYRARHPTAASPVAPQHISRTHPEVVRPYGSYLWLDPGEPVAADHSLAVIRDVVRRYDIDGVHLDDYFYPYHEQDAAGQDLPFPDDASWQRAVDTGERRRRDDWRRHNVDRFVERLYRMVKQEKPWVKVGISPFGIWRPGHPEQIQGYDAYARLYADSRKWLREGWVDYFSPQLYWKIEERSLSYPVLLAWWQKQNRKGRHLWPGNFTSRICRPDRGDWPPREIIDQINLTRAQPGATGNIHFSMICLMQNRRGIADQLAEDSYARPALVPPSSWLAEDGPGRPSVTFLEDATAIVMTPAEGETAWRWIIRAQYGEAWTWDVVSGRQTTYSLPAPAGVPDVLAVSVVDRLGQEGPAVTLKK